MIFVFGSNLAGRHGKGAALFARQNKGAIYGQGLGPQGESYAIPTKDSKLKPLPIGNVELYVTYFLDYAKNHPELIFELTPIGCGLAGFTPEQIAPMFKNHSMNIVLPKEFTEILYPEWQISQK